MYLHSYVSIQEEKKIEILRIWKKYHLAIILTHKIINSPSIGWRLGWLWRPIWWSWQTGLVRRQRCSWLLFQRPFLIFGWFLLNEVKTVRTNFIFSKYYETNAQIAISYLPMNKIAQIMCYAGLKHRDTFLYTLDCRRKWDDKVAWSFNSARFQRLADHSVAINLLERILYENITTK